MGFYHPLGYLLNAKSVYFSFCIYVTKSNKTRILSSISRSTINQILNIINIILFFLFFFFACIFLLLLICSRVHSYANNGFRKLHEENLHPFYGTSMSFIALCVILFACSTTQCLVWMSHNIALCSWTTRCLQLVYYIRVAFNFDPTYQLHCND